MADINPFEVPPLIEWENCITHDELIATIKAYAQVYQNTPKWKWIQRRNIRVALSVLESMDWHIHQKQEMQGGAHEEVN